MNDFMMTIQPDNGFEKYICDRAYEQGVPISGTFELLPACNMNCKMCYIRTSVEEMKKIGEPLSVDQWTNIAKQLKDNGTLFLLLTGGEPLLYRGFKELYKAISSLGIIITVNTNGTLINEEIIRLFKEYPPRRLNISLYGASDKTYAKLCDYPRGFTLVMHNIKRLVEEKIPIKINYTISRGNVKDWYKIIKITEELNIPISTPTYMFPPVRKEGKQIKELDYRLSPKEAAYMQYQVVKYGVEENPDSIQWIKDTLNDIEIKRNNKKYIDVPCGYLCKAGVSSFWINWKGMLTACGMIENPYWNLNNGLFKDGWAYIKQESQKVKTCQDCFCCEYRSICINCGAASMAENNDMTTKVDYHCELCKEYEKLLKELLNEVNTNENK